MEVFKKHPSVQNTSVMGAGKTYWTAAIAIALDLPIVVVCPSFVKSVWEEIVSNYGVKHIEIMSYEIMAGRKKAGCNHGLLTRKNDEFHIAINFEKRVDEGILFVIDESHNTKNETAKYLHACKAISTCIARKFRNGCRSRIISLSGTPGDKKEHAESICKIQGFQLQDDLVHYDPSAQVHELLGLQEIADHAYSINPSKTLEIMRVKKMSAAEAKKIAFRLYTEILKNVYAIDMALPPPKVKQYIYSGHFQYLPQDAALSAAGEKLLRENVEFKNGQWTMKKGKKTLDVVIKALQLIEWAKLNICVRKGMEILKGDPNGKLVIFSWGLEAISYLMDQFSDYRVEKLVGTDMNDEEKRRIVRRFQEQNLNTQVLIINPQVAAQGVSLDDRSENGAFKRYFLIIPHFKFTLMEQAFGRFFRVSTTSDSYGWIIFSNEFLEEQAILQSVFSKSEDCTAFLAGGRKVGLNPNTPKEMEPKSQISFVPKPSSHMSNAVKDYFNNSRTNQYTGGFQTGQPNYFQAPQTSFYQPGPSQFTPSWATSPAFAPVQSTSFAPSWASAPAPGAWTPPQAPQMAPPQFQPPPQQFQAPQFQVPPQQFQAPQFQAPPQQFQAPQFQAPPQQFQAPPTQFQFQAPPVSFT
jgi:hypothetical protein